ncbi:PDR/VanB family oxidoreductase [Pseudarthrobacter sp. R1]|uniref:PDR/VanB family oxidoreductase n=1 Tax=Pseudarthrobacter sp. R1 TaxID=2944934 RepID=UPI00210DF3E9|nr:PDR/VanB family oxidoreductase [Pseudarthrobacter sp. R1]MCQ6273340.1 PDR/VanB family oxidoreductase [Pseudarthrobacter sp. R1]
MTTLQHERELTLPAGQLLDVRVNSARREAESITSYELGRTDGGPLPAWAPGAHVDVHLPSGTVRQYSVCGDPADATTYRIAVLELPEGRGGSLEVHRELRPGRILSIGAPRQNFSLADAGEYVFVAGGIGITPLLPMIHQVQQRGLPWKLVYGARTAEHFAFLGELASLRAPSLQLYAQDTDGHPDLAAVVRDNPAAAVYTCGPAGLMDALSTHMAAAGRLHQLHLERFAPAAPPVDGPEDSPSGAVTESFEVELERTGTVITVGPNESVLDAVRAAGVQHPSSCEMGFCGTCEVKVLCGKVDHRDDLLTETERENGNSMMICVSRSASPRLVLDL